METITQTEITFYQDANVVVTQSRYVTNSKTYAMRNTSSEYVVQIAKSKTGPFLIALVGFLMLFGNEVRILGFLIFAVGIPALLMLKDEYAVRISTNAGEANSLISKDRAYIQKIVNALNDAIIHRG